MKKNKPGQGRKPDPLSKKKLILRCSDEEWASILLWHQGKPRDRALEILGKIDCD